MSDETMLKEWNRFSGSIGGAVSMTKENYFDHDNNFNIKAGDNEIELTWGNQPQKGRGVYVTAETTFKFPLGNAASIKFNVYPSDTVSKIFSVFNRSKRKTGIKELDDAYIFICNSENIITGSVEEFRSFHKNNCYKNFVIDIEEITDKPTLKIYVPELMTDQKALYFYYSFGSNLKKIIDIPDAV